MADTGLLKIAASKMGSFYIRDLWKRVLGLTEKEDTGILAHLTGTAVMKTENGNGQPYILTISGPFCAGKSTFYKELITLMPALGHNVKGVMNYKNRGPKTKEFPGIDYMQIESDVEFEELVKKGKILVSYIRDGSKYGLSRAFLDALTDNHTPVMEMQIDGFANLMQFLKDQQLPNKVISFMLHTSKADAKARLFERAGADISDEDAKSIKKHLQGLEDEFEAYKTHEYLFRHVFKNDTLEGISKYQRVQHITNRAVEIIDLERRLNKETPGDFREAYVDEVVDRLFGTSTADLVSSINQGVQLKIPDNVIENYSLKQGIDSSILREIGRKRVIAQSNNYGVLSLYLESTTNRAHKRYLVDLIEETVDLSPQYKDIEVHPSKDSRFTLKQLSEKEKGLIDFYISFSPYDPIKTQRVDSKIHTIAFESVLLNRSPHIEPVVFDRAVKYVEGNGS